MKIFYFVEQIIPDGGDVITRLETLASTELPPDTFFECAEYDKYRNYFADKKAAQRFYTFMSAIG